MKCLIHLSEPSLNRDIASFCKESFLKESAGLKVVWIEQDKETPKCWLSLYRQLMKGVEQADADHVGVCEHDVLYAREHLEHVPTDDVTFFYNSNHWLYQWSNVNHPELDGMFSYWPNRTALSQLVCNRQLLYDLLRSRIAILEGNDKEIKEFTQGEFGAPPPDVVKKAMKWARREGKATHIAPYVDKYIRATNCAFFKTEIPNVDIRHGSNFSGPKRGKKRCWGIPYWGNLNRRNNGSN